MEILYFEDLGDIECRLASIYNDGQIFTHFAVSTTQMCWAAAPIAL